MIRLLAAACGAALLGATAAAQTPPPVPTPVPVPAPAPKDPVKDPAPAVKPVVVPVILSVTAEELTHTFATNEVRATRLYADKTVQITGRLVRVAVNRDAAPSADARDAYQVELQGKANLPVDVDVTYYFPRAARPQLDPLLAGQDIMLRGRVEQPVVYPRDGRVRLRDLVTVAVSDCRLVGILPPVVTPPLRVVREPAPPIVIVPR